MELGNLIFGNSRGSFPIDRHSGFEDQLYLLFEAVHGPDFSSYGEDFSNDTFSIMSYYWGDCTCGLDNLEDCPEKHTSSCYQTYYRALTDSIKKKTKEWNSPEERREVKKLCDTFKLPYPNGCAVHCTCDRGERADKWYTEKGYPIGHLDTCMFSQPNFHYKPTDFRIEWYKYPLRDSYMNQEMDIGNFTLIIQECIKSLTKL